jgi:hypothetical protein
MNGDARRDGADVFAPDRVRHRSAQADPASFELRFIVAARRSAAFASSGHPALQDLECHEA